MDFNSLPKLLIMLPLAAACTSEPEWASPEVSEKQFSRLSDLVYSLECELNEAVAAVPEYRKYADQPAAVHLKLKVSEAPSPNGGVTLAVPVGPAQVTLSGSGKSTFTASRTMEVKFKINPAKIAPCTPERARKLDVDRIEAGLGLEQWIEQVINVLETAGQLPDYLNYATSFQVINTPKGTLKFVNSAGTGTGTIDLGKSNKVDYQHTATITIAEFDKKPKSAGQARQKTTDDLDRAAESFILREAISQLTE